jgi:hypothetical protein
VRNAGSGMELNKKFWWVVNINEIEYIECTEIQFDEWYVPLNKGGDWYMQVSTNSAYSMRLNTMPG